MHQLAADRLAIDGVLDVFSPVAQAYVGVVENRRGGDGVLAVSKATSGQVRLADAPGRLACFGALHLAAGKPNGPDPIPLQHCGDTECLTNARRTMDAEKQRPGSASEVADEVQVDALDEVRGDMHLRPGGLRIRGRLPLSCFMVLAFSAVHRPCLGRGRSVARRGRRDPRKTAS